MGEEEAALGTVLGGAETASDLAAAVIGPDGITRAVSPGFARLIGAEAAALVGRSIEDLLTGWEPLAGDTPTLRRSEGDALRVLEVQFGEIGEQRIVALFDVTHHAMDEERLAELARFPEKNPGPVLWIDREATVLVANGAARHAFGEDIVGACWLDRCPGMTDEIWGRARNAQEPLIHDTDVEAGCFSMAHVSSDQGDFVFAFGSDITERRKAEKQLAEVARFPDMNPGPVLRLDADGVILLANRAARRVFGDEVTGKSWHEVLPASAKRWDEIRTATGNVIIETRFGERDYLFTHRSDRESTLVFVFGADVTEQKQAEQGFRQAEKMATLGTLAAGVAHELNNPAAAARRAADQLRDAFERLQAAQFALDEAAPSDAVRARLRELDAVARANAERPSDLDTVTRSDREVDLEDWLDDHDIDQDADIAPTLVDLGLDAAQLEQLATDIGDEMLGPAIVWAAAAFPVYRLAYEIGQGASRISEIVGALKSYSYLGQASRQEIDLHEGLDNTLIILRNKLKVGIDVRRDYADALPRILAFGSELNQVWTNLLDNAADAMGGKGTITIATRADGDDVVVTICDDGPGIPPEIRARVFDPFFTTKAPGKGTGLGLATTYGIVAEKHGGTITIESKPGETCFTVRLPITTKE